MYRGGLPPIGTMSKSDDCLDEHLQLPVSGSEIENHHHVVAGHATGSVSFAFCLNPGRLGRGRDSRVHASQSLGRELGRPNRELGAGDHAPLSRFIRIPRLDNVDLGVDSVYFQVYFRDTYCGCLQNLFFFLQPLLSAAEMPQLLLGGSLVRCSGHI